MTTMSPFALALLGPPQPLSLLFVLLAAGGTLLALLVVAALVAWHFVVTCPPGHIAVLTGRGSTRPDGSRVGYRLCRGGRTLRVPFGERLEFLDVTSQYVPVALPGALTADNQRLDVEVAADIRITDEPAFVYNAVEYFLGAPPNTLSSVASDVLTGAIRAALAETSAAEALHDHELLTQRIGFGSEEGLTKLGLVLDMLTIVNVRPA